MIVIEGTAAPAPDEEDPVAVAAARAAEAALEAGEEWEAVERAAVEAAELEAERLYFKEG